MSGFYIPLPEPFDPVADLARRQQLRANRLAMLQAERQMAQEDALAAHAPGLGSPDPAKRTNALAQIAALGPRGMALAAPLLQSEREAAALREALGAPEGIAPTPAAAALPAPAPGGAGFFDALRASENATGDPGARNPRSTATGDFQFIDSTWRRFAAAHPQLFQGMTDAQVLAARADPRLSRMAAEWYARENAGALSGAGLPVTPGTLALAHRFGAAGAQALLRAAPETPVAEVVGADVMRANPDLAGRTVGQVVGGFQARFGGAGAPAAAADVSGAGRGGLDPNALVQQATRMQAQATRLRAIGSPRAMQLADGLEQRALQMMALAQRGERTDVTERLLDRWRELAARGDALTPTEAAERDMLVRRLSGQGVNVNVEAPQIGSIPPGYQLVREGNTMRLEPIPGGPAAQQVEQRQRAEQAQQRQQQREGNIVVQDIDRILGIVGSSALPVTGAGGSFLSRIPGTAARDVAALLDTLRAATAFNRLQQMREASPTGGALGQITERELALLQSTLGSLEQEQSQEQFVRNLRRLRSLFLDTVHGPGNYDPATGEPRAQGEQGGVTATPPPAATAPVRVRTPAEARALPPGTLYVTPDGQTYRR